MVQMNLNPVNTTSGLLTRFPYAEHYVLSLYANRSVPLGTVQAMVN